MIDTNGLIRRRIEWVTAAEQGGEVARRAAHDALRDVGAAVQRIHENLRDLGYPSVAGLVPPPANARENISEVRAATGDVPEILECFWEVIGGIQLVALPGYAHVDFWKRQGMHWNPGTCDGVWIYSCDDEFRTYLINEVEQRAGYAAEGIDSEAEAEPFQIDLSPDHYHKDDISGGASYALDAKPGWLAPLRWFEWTGPVRPRSAPEGVPDFLSYLRTALFECAGFPGYYGLPRFEPIREKLLVGVELG